MAVGGGKQPFEDTSWSTTSDFPVLTQSQFNTFNSVINNLPSNASSWADLTQSFNSLGLDEAQDDSYSLLLKLTLETGRDWREKWNAVKRALEAKGVVYEQMQDHPKREGGGRRATTTLQSTPVLVVKDERKSTPRLNPVVGSRSGKSTKPATFDLLKSKLANVTTTSATPRPSSYNPQPLPLPTTSNPPTRDFLVKPTHGHCSSDDYDGVPSPSASRFRLPPPPKAPLLSRTTAITLPSRTPTTTTRRESSHGLPLQQTPAIRTSSPTAPYDSLRLPTLLESRADDFRKFSLMSLVWYHWRVALSTVVDREVKVDQSRRAVLLRWTLGLWRMKWEQLGELERLRKDLEKRTIQLKKRMLMEKWVRKTEKRKMERWELRLRESFEICKRRSKERRKRNALEHWRQATMASKATRFRYASLLAPVLSAWVSKFRHLKQLDETADEMGYKRHASSATVLLRRWRQEAELSFLERHHKSVEQEKVMKNCWSYWKQRTAQARQIKRMEEVATEVGRQRQKKGALNRWRGRLVHNQLLIIRSDQLLQKRNHSHLSHHLHYWLTSCSGSLLLQARGVRSARKCLAKWIQRHLHIAIALEGRSIAFAARAEEDIKFSVMSQWIQSLERTRTASKYAMKVDEGRLIRGFFAKWKKKKEDSDLLSAKAVVAEGFFAQRAGWNRWAERIQRRKVERWEEGVKSKSKRVFFAEWLAATRRAKAAEILVDTFQNAVNMHLLANAVQQWTSKLVEMRSREYEVTSRYELSLVKFTFDKWVQVCLRHGEDHSLVENFLLVKDQELAMKTLRHWLRNTRRSVELKRRLENLLEAKRQATLETAFAKWRDASLRGLEKEVVSMREARVLTVAWELWVKRTRILPAIQFDKINTRRKFLKVWRDQVTDPALTKQATGWDRLTTTGHCLNIWKARFQAKAAMRSVNRFRHFGTSPSSNRSSFPRSLPPLGIPSLVSPPARSIEETQRPSPSHSARSVSLRIPIPSPPVLPSIPFSSSSIPRQPTPILGSSVPSSLLWSRPSSAASGELRPRVSEEYSRSESRKSEELGRPGRESGLRARLRATAMANRSS